MTPALSLFLGTTAGVVVVLWVLMAVAVHVAQ
jgi:hypothetical protein